MLIILRNNDILFIRAETNPENFIDKIKLFSPDAIYFIDAVEFDGKVGEVKVFDINEVLNESLSTHGISVKVFKDFFPDTKIYIIGIKPGNIEYGERLDLSLKKNFNQILEGIKKFLELS